jgi:hypothetical protein
MQISHLFMASFVSAGPLSYGICQTGCNALVVACYGAAGFTFGTVTAGVGVPAAIVGCNAGLGVCMDALRLGVRRFSDDYRLLANKLMI